MVLNKCWACGEIFNAFRISKLCCSISCRKMYQSEYDQTRYIEFRNAKREKRRQMISEKYSISSSNLYKIINICDECLTQFYHDYSIFEKFNETYVSSFNATEWGAAICPHCGLINDELYKITKPFRSKKPMVKLEAIYIKNHIDFIAEGEAVRKMLNNIYKKGNLTQEEINLCIATTFRKIRETKL